MDSLPFVPNLKSWGFSVPLLRDPSRHLDMCIVRRGGHSSKHYHAAKTNSFLLVSGKLKLVIYANDIDEEPQQIYLHAHTATWHFLPARTIHRFVCGDSAVLIEKYEPMTLDSHILAQDDIVRFDEGGIYTDSELAGKW